MKPKIAKPTALSAAGLPRTGSRNRAAAPASRTTQITASATPAGLRSDGLEPLSSARVRCSVAVAASVAASAVIAQAMVRM